MNKHLIFLFLLLLIAGIAKAQTLLDSSRSYCLTQTQETIKIDGELNETVWQKAEKTGDFWQQFPYDTALARTKTEVMMAYDQHNIYVAAICYDGFDGNYVVSSLKRDFTYTNNDAFAVYIDPFNDKTNGVTFAVNPYGAQQEGLIQNGGSFGSTINWDNKWFSEVKRHKGYWITEFKIPFKTLRYKEGVNQWGVNFSRNNQKINENSSWCAVPRNFDVASLAHTGKLLWEAPSPKAGLNISLIPYAISRFTKNYAAQTAGEHKIDAGFDAKVSVTPSLNLDLTVNPDFSQVDVDRQVTNLTRFSLFFPEQRQFFLENSDLFGSFGFSKIRPFFSRRIGLKNGSSVTIPIIAGTRLSGKLDKNWRMGLMNIQTQAYNEGNIVANPENFTVAAVQRQVFARSNIAAIVVNKQNLNGADSAANAYNRIVGLDYNLASADNKWQGKFFFHHSFSPNQPKNAFAHASWLRYSSPRWFIMWNHEYVGNNYQADVGFVPRQRVYDGTRNIEVAMTYWRLEPEVTYSFYPKNSKIYAVKSGIYTSWYADSSLFSNDAVYDPYLQIIFLNTAEIGIDYKLNQTYLYFPIDITGTGNVPLPVGNYHYNNISASYTSNRRKKFNWSAFVSYGGFFNGEQLSYGCKLYYRAQPWGNFSLNFETNEIKLPQPYGYTNLTLIGPRMEFTFSRSLFLTTFVQYNTQIENVNINTRLQWRFAPMSDLFIVWGDNYNPINNAGRALPDFRVRDRGVVIKLVYWLGI